MIEILQAVIAVDRRVNINHGTFISPLRATVKNMQTDEIGTIRLI